MGGRGFAPKPPEQRRTRHKPQLGEVRSAPAESWRFGPVPALPEGMCKATDEAWRRWFSGWWASFWTPGDLPGLYIVAKVHDLVSKGDSRLASELRLQMDGYGITPKGRLSLRWAPPKSADPETTLPSPDDGPDASVRQAAADALGAIGPAASAAVPALTALLDDPEWYVKDSAKSALERLTGAKPSVAGCTVPDVGEKTVSEARAMWAQAGFYPPPLPSPWRVALPGDGDGLVSSRRSGNSFSASSPVTSTHARERQRWRVCAKVTRRRGLRWSAQAPWGHPVSAA